MFSTVPEALQDLRSGKIIIVVDDENRENEGDFVTLAEHATPENINFMATHGRGLICAPIARSIAEKLNLHPMVSQNEDNFQTAFTVSIDHKSTTTGISASERSETIQQLINEHSNAEDFKRPGHIFPLIAKENGVLTRPGHTEAAVDLANMCDSSPAGVICEIMNEDGTMARVPQLLEIAEKFDLKILTIAELIHYRYNTELIIKEEACIELPTGYGDFKMHGYSNFLDESENVALVKGNIEEDDPVLVRIHSACLTGDIFHSKRCDCGPQLERSLEIIENSGNGVILYMQQEGRGIGLLNKLRAYELQQQGYDTVEANEMLGFPAEMRNYAISAHILKDLGIKKVKLLTNNPEKITALTDCGIEVVERVPLEVKTEAENENYLLTKKEKMGHMLSLEATVRV
ncbi:bifunctional 3,4-dihydroxy-2-butanone-4-phosphate synthase/GTP cyclohydrolase II [Bacillus sp. AGMB 02131]|uniref:Riboflavin biosynthesis protein RibBA n=1 Tax=Peribacillus faecalis TaxID=2772559 RepID=A0A927CVZ0_9BACI|nr:bifunctional 3,4-dihydroxy-2-butanone-4-phosphate synthase/GTP cyclohydrolase II [Peribacillus faecalis]MBD3107772.1 bifunctional 3,4-dihydroxy-2-butanone-4-phosphate synthase/GTP cyclohydrolase II [Peribacillus faecalis]